VTAGTLFQDTRKPLRVWFRALWQVTNPKGGTSALGLQRTLGLGSYPTAWLWLHKMRRAMVRAHRAQLTGRVEVDETFVGGEAIGNRGRSGAGKRLVAIAVEENGPRLGRIRMHFIPDASKASLHAFVRQTIAPGSLVHTDGWDSYKGLAQLGYKHQISALKGRGKSAATQLLPRVHLVASLLKRWLLGTLQGSVSPQHLAFYLDEFTFRFNRRSSKSRGLLFYRLLQQAVAVDPIRGKVLFGGRKPEKPQ
jgi:transposase-like protein